jgi:hypothetical protein
VWGDLFKAISACVFSRSLTVAVQSVNREIGKNAHKSKDAWVRIASSVQSRTLAQSFFNALPAETARWKRCVPRFAPINVWKMDLFNHFVIY